MAKSEPRKKKLAKIAQEVLAKLPQGPISGDPWTDRPQDVRRFLEQRDRYAQLGNEVAYILGKRLEAQGIKSFSVTHRAKELGSFLEKTQRKSYSDPFTEITDFAGARIVCYYPDDLPKIRQIIHNSFSVVEEASKGKDKLPDQFGYLADHYLVRLGPATAGARYDDLKDLVCEVQARTVLQDAWAVFSHHLLYKRESEMPDDLKRRINALAGVFENADLTFQEIRDKRDQYFEEVKKARGEDLDLLPTNLDSLQAFLPKLSFGGTVHSINDNDERQRIRWAIQDTNLIHHYPTLRDVRSLIQRTEKARVAARDRWLLYFDPSSPASELLLATLLDVPEKALSMTMNNTLSEIVNSSRALVEPR